MKLNAPDDIISHTADIYFCRKRKLELIPVFANARNVEIN